MRSISSCTVTGSIDWDKRWIGLCRGSRSRRWWRRSSYTCRCFCTNSSNIGTSWMTPPPDTICRIPRLSTTQSWRLSYPLCRESNVQVKSYNWGGVSVITNHDKIRQSSGLEYEYLLKESLRNRSIPFRTEAQMRYVLCGVSHVVWTVCRRRRISCWSTPFSSKRQHILESLLPASFTARDGRKSTG